MTTTIHEKMFIEHFEKTLGKNYVSFKPMFLTIFKANQIMICMDRPETWVQHVVRIFEMINCGFTAGMNSKQMDPKQININDAIYAELSQHFGIRLNIPHRIPG